MHNKYMKLTTQKNIRIFVKILLKTDLYKCYFFPDFFIPPLAIKKKSEEYNTVTGFTYFFWKTRKIRTKRNKFNLLQKIYVMMLYNVSM